MSDFKFNVSPPPFYNELGKSAKDLFNRGYNFDTVKIDVKTKTPTGVEFSCGGTSHIDSGKVLGTLETKYKFKEYGINFSEKWNTSNVLATEVSVDNFLKGSKFATEGTFAPQTGDKTLKIKAEYRNNYLAFNSDADFKTATPLITASGVLHYNGWLVGLLSKFDTKDSKLKSNNLALGYTTKEFVIHTNVSDGKLYSGHIYQKVNPFLETGIELAWSSENNDTKFGLGCKYAWDRDTTIRAKVNNSSQIGLGFAHKLRDGITITLSTLIDGKNFNQGGHKVGMGIEFEP